MLWLWSVLRAVSPKKESDDLCLEGAESHSVKLQLPKCEAKATSCPFQADFTSLDPFQCNFKCVMMCGKSYHRKQQFEFYPNICSQ